MQQQQTGLLEDNLEYLAFEVGGQKYAVAIASVREIRGWTKPDPLPGMDPCNLGVINLRGETLPLLDLAAKLGLETPEINERSVIVVTEEEHHTTGLLVDSVSNIIAPPPETIKEPPQAANSTQGNFVSALTLMNDEVTRILDLRHVVETRP